MSTKTATLVKKISPAPGTGVDARLYRLDPPLEGHEFVRTSATDVMFSGPETYIFPADENGAVTDWGELDGSFKGGLDHEEALRGAGYTVTN